MAKNKRTDVRHLEEDDLGEQLRSLRDDPSVAAATLIVDRAPVEELVAEVSIPISEELPSEFMIHLDVTLPPPSATTLRRIAQALDRRQACTSDGQRVTKPTHALRWLLEQVTIRSV